MFKILRTMNDVMTVAFKKVEVVGANKDAAIAAANLGFDRINGDATQKYKKWLESQNGAVTDKDIKNFCLEYLKDKVKLAPGIGYTITLESAVADTRERPWTIIDVKNEKGKRKYSTIYELRDDATNAILAINKDTKASAKKLAQEVIAKHAAAILNGEKSSFSGKGTCYQRKDVVEGEPVAFKFQYTPSANQKNGRWLVFGVER